jgi:SpoVK/Ycf46/Vps4 family AAA+-type ATPase
VLKALCHSDSGRDNVALMMTPAAPLLRWQLLQRSSPDDVADSVSVDPRIAAFLLGDDRLDARLDTVAVLEDAISEPAATSPDLARAAALLHDRTFGDGAGRRSVAPVVYLHDAAEGGAGDLAAYLAGAAAKALLRADIRAVLASANHDVTALIRILCREALLSDAVLYIDDADALLDHSARPVLNALRRSVTDAGPILILAGGRSPGAGACFSDALLSEISVGSPDVATRSGLWRTALGADSDPAVIDALAARYVMSGRQIRNATRRAAHSPGGTADPDALMAACRAESDQDFGGLAVKVTPRRSWTDLVLPDDTIAALHEICNHICHRHQVYEEWGYRQLGHTPAVTVLFSGPPGTGKTIAAQVLAKHAGLNLYKIDLSAVVSKYIGETEKHLAVIFARARAANAVLFFDEADALFGKRTEVSDAHDRYANIETSYLLQKLEDHDGVVILASNLRANLDDAFTRRIRLIVEFPFPEASLRKRLWAAHFPAAAPLSEDIDFNHLATALPIAGGNISNVALTAALLAAGDGQPIGTAHIMAAARREYDKLGKLWTALPVAKERT